MKFEIDMLPVGDSNGDAILMRYGEPSAFGVNLIDGGFVDTAETILSHLDSHYGGRRIDNLVLSHADNDHATGLVGVLKSADVRNVYMNLPWLYAPLIIDSFHGNWTLEGLTQKIKEMHPYLVEIASIAAYRQIPVHPVFAGTRIGPNFTVLAPSAERYIKLLPDLDKTPQSYADKKGIVGAMLQGARNVLDVVREAWDLETLDANPPATSPSNETSVVQMGVFGDKKILLTADVGPEGLQEALNHARAFGLSGAPYLIQVPHHGSRRNVTPAILNAWLGAPLPDKSVRGYAFCSVGKDADIYPRKKVKNAFIRRGYPVWATRGCSLRHSYGWPERPGWSTCSPEAFDPNVGEED